MFFPESLYLLSARDQQVTWLDPSIIAVAVATAAVVVNAELSVPQERALILQSAHSRGVGGGAQTANFQAIQLIDAAGLQFVNLKTVESSGGAIAFAIDWQGSIIIPPFWRVRASVTYSAGAIANTTRLSVAGLLIPIGNIQRL